MKKKILIATDTFMPRRDGIARFLSEIIPKLQKKYDMTVIAPNHGEFTASYNLIRFPLQKNTYGDFTPAKVDNGIIDKAVEQNDIVWIQTLGPIGIAAIKFAKKHKKPLIGYGHVIEWDLFSRSVKRFKKVVNVGTRVIAKHYYNKCDVIMVPFLEMRELLKAEGINHPIKVVVNLGMDTATFVPPVSKAKAKEAIGIPIDKKVIGYCGRLAREKDLMTLLDAFKSEQKKRENIVLVIVGDGLEEIKKAFKETKDVYLVGTKDNVVPYLQAMDIFVLPSLTETTSLATLEAMACGCVVIVTPVGYMKIYIKDKVNGFFFPPRNSLVLKLKMDYILDNPLATREVSMCARNTIEDMFDWDKTVKKIESVLDQFLHLR